MSHKNIVLLILLLLPSFCFGALSESRPRILVQGTSGINRIKYRCGIGVENTYDQAIRDAETWEATKSCYDAMKTQYDSGISGDTLKNSYAQWKRPGVILGLAILYWCNSEDTTYSDYAIDTLITDDIDSEAHDDEAPSMIGLAMVYDYFYDELSVDENTNIEHTLMTSSYVQAQLVAPADTHGVWNGHNYYYERPMIPFAYLAIAGETKTDATVSGGAYNGTTVTASTFDVTCLGWFTTYYENEILPAWNQVAGTQGNGGSSMGWGTYLGGSMWYTPMVLMAWRDAGVEDFVSTSNYIQYAVKHLLYGLRPNRDSVISKNDDADSRVLEVSTGFTGLLFCTYLTTQSDCLTSGKWAIDKGDSDGTGEPVYDFVKPFYVLLYPDQINGAVPSFDDVTYQDGTGDIIYKTGFDDTISNSSDNMLFAFHCGPFYDGHSHYNNGAIQLFYKGDLLVNTGHYPGDLTGAHYFDYYKRTVAGNAVLIYDSSEDTSSWYFQGNDTTYNNDGGQKILLGTTEIGEYNSWRPQNYGDILDGGDFNVGDIEYVEDNNYYVATIGEYTKSYAAAKIDEIKRGFVAFKDVNDIVLLDWIDKPSGNTSTDVRILFHSMDYPTVTGVVDSDDRNEYDGGEITYSSASLIKITDEGQTYCTKEHTGGSGIVYISPVFPSANNLYIVGGPAADDGECQSDSYEFYSNGTQYNITTSSDDTPEMGVWRTEIRNDSHSENEFFINAMHVTDSALDTPTATAITASQGGMYGVHLAHDTIEKIVMMTPSSTVVSSTIVYQYTETSENTTYNIIINVSGSFSITASGTDTKTITLDSSGNTYSPSGEGVLAFSVDHAGAITQLNTPVSETPHNTTIGSGSTCKLGSGATVQIQ